MKQSSLSAKIYLGLIYAFFYIPIVVLIIYSFNKAQYSLIWHGASVQWYQQLFHDYSLWRSVGHSLIIGTLAATTASIIGTLAAINLYRYKFHGKQLLHVLIFILIVTPDLVMGTSLLVLYNITDFALGFWSLLIAHITFCLPFVCVLVYSRISTFDKEIFSAATDLGANESTLFFKVLLPLLMPAILAGWLLSFTLSFDDVIISYFVSGPSFQILPLVIYSMVRVGINPEVNALCAIIFSLSLLLVLSAHFLFNSRK